MATPREQAGGLAEASRLLQEGLQLLDERQQEVDRLLEDARERSLLIREEAELRAAEITAEAEKQRAEIEEQVATLRGEVEALRTELASLRGTVPAPAGAEPATSVQATPAPAEPAPQHELTAFLPAPLDDQPHWGRRTNSLAAHQAVKSGRSSRPRWLSWLPFVLVLLVAATLWGSNLASTFRGDAGTIAVASAPARVEVAAAQVTPTAVVAAPSSPTRSGPTSTPTSQPMALPPAGAQLGTPAMPPSDTAPQGPIVAA
jgi:hypothetical protein